MRPSVRLLTAWACSGVGFLSTHALASMVATNVGAVTVGAAEHAALFAVGAVGGVGGLWAALALIPRRAERDGEL